MSLVDRRFECAKLFRDSIVEAFGSRVYKVILFSSIAKGSTGLDSYVDILVVIDNIKEGDDIILSKLTLEVSSKCGIPIEYITMSLGEYRLRGGDNPFIYEVERWALTSSPPLKGEAFGCNSIREKCLEL